MQEVYWQEILIPLYSPSIFRFSLTKIQEN